jgi:hypothetical protein
MISNFLKLIKKNKKNIIISILFVVFFILFLGRQIIINRGMNRIIGNFNNVVDCSELDQYDCSFRNNCQYHVEKNSCVEGFNSGDDSGSNSSSTDTKQSNNTTNNNDANNSSTKEEDNILVEEESFLPMSFNGQNNIYLSSFFGFGNLFAPHTEIYN